MVRTLRFHCRGPGVQSLVGALGSCKLLGVTKNNNENKTKQNKNQKKPTMNSYLF